MGRDDLGYIHKLSATQQAQFCFRSLALAKEEREKGEYEGLNSLFPRPERQEPHMFQICDRTMTPSEDSPSLTNKNFIFSNRRPIF